MKDKLKKEHGNKLHDCNFGIKEFNKHKKKLDPQEAATANKPSKPAKGGTKPPVPSTGNNVFLLDFTGFLVSGTSWNYAGDFTCAPANLTAAQVDEIIADVVSSFAIYNVIVTTDETVYTAAAPDKRMRCILTETHDWYGDGAGGVSFNNSFKWTTNEPCFVFTSLLGYSTKFIKEATTHELGHTVGLYHQSSYDTNCVKLSEYNYGDGVTAPIMGAGYYVPDSGSKWWVGPNSYGCTSIQDDNSVITATLGLKK